MLKRNQRLSPWLLAMLVILLLFSGLSPVARAASSSSGTIGPSLDAQPATWGWQIYGAQALPDITRMDYSPIGFFKPGDPIPSPLNPPTNPNPSGKWVAYDVNVFETLNYPSRHPGDMTANDPPGSGTRDMASVRQAIRPSRRGVSATTTNSNTSTTSSER